MFIYRFLVYILILFSFSSCVVSKNLANKDDPYEAHNRKMLLFNKRILENSGSASNAKNPLLARQLAGNFFANISLVPKIVSDIFSLEPKNFVMDSSRFFINSTLGGFGLFDIATKVGIPLVSSGDFGTGLIKYGWKDSDFIILPFLGPTTVRDGFGNILWLFCDPIIYLDSLLMKTSMYGFNKLLQLDDVMDLNQALSNAEVFDEYIFVRDSYLQSRSYQANSLVENSQNLDDVDFPDF